MQSPRDRILDAAEDLFSRLGYDGVPVRRIAREANVELASVTYYFEKKEALFRQVVARRAPELIQANHDALDAAYAAADGNPPKIEALIKAIVAPTLNRLQEQGGGWKHYIRLISSLASIENDRPDAHLFHEHYEVIIERFIKGVREALPSLSDESIYLSYHFLNSACLHIFQQHDSIESISKGAVRTSDYDKVLANLCGFFASGFYYMDNKEK